MKNMLRFKKILVGAAALFALQLHLQANAAYPEQPVRLVVTWPPGGSADAIGRLLGHALEKGLGRAVVVENAAGASGLIGTGQVARALPDGYTLVLATSTTNAAGPSLFKNLPFDPVDGFVPITLAASAPSALIVAADSRYKSVTDLIEVAKSKPGELNYGSGGIGNSGHLSAALFADAAHIDVTHVPYKGNSPATMDLIGGQIDFMFDNNPVGLIKGGKVRALATTGAKRTSALSDVPTLKELGMPKVYLTTWFGLAAPKGTPPEVIKIIDQALIKGMQEENTSEKLVRLGFEPDILHPAEFKTFWNEELSRYEELVKLSGAKKE